MSEKYKGTLPNQGCVEPFMHQRDTEEVPEGMQAEMWDVVESDMTAAPYTLQQEVIAGYRRPRSLDYFQMCTNLLNDIN